ncbi:MAG: hypothetical protein ACREMU_10115 [Gemmatimonadaceae bacterium]
MEARVDAAPLSDAEIAELATLVQSGGAAADVHRALLLLARRHTADAEHAIHALLEQPLDAENAALALRTLCLRWGLGERYGALLRHFVRGVRWVAEGDVQRAAITIAGEVLASQTDTELMFDLIRLSEDAADDATRGAAVRALARATGYHGRPVDLRLDL